MDLITTNVLALRDDKKWAIVVRTEEKERKLLTAASDNWKPVSGFVEKKFLTRGKNKSKKGASSSTTKRRQSKATLERKSPNRKIRNSKTKLTR